MKRILAFAAMVFCAAAGAQTVQPFIGQYSAFGTLPSLTAYDGLLNMALHYNSEGCSAAGQVVGYISGTSLHVTSVTFAGTFANGMTVNGSGVTTNTTITSVPGGGGVGTYGVTPSQTVSSNPGENLTFATCGTADNYAISQTNYTELVFQVRPGDMWVNDLAAGDYKWRAEIAGGGSGELSTSGYDAWFSMDLEVDPGGPTTVQWSAMGQYHPNDSSCSGCSPAWSMELSDYATNIDNLTCSGTPPAEVFGVIYRTNTTDTSPAPVQLYADCNFQRGVWHHWVWDIVYGQSGTSFCCGYTTGKIQGWRDGILVVNYSGPVGYPDTGGQYFNFGRYSYPGTDTMIVRYRNLQFCPSACPIGILAGYSPQ